MDGGRLSRQSQERRLARVFDNKVVQELSCAFCEAQLCRRGMRALLLADTATELFSTDVRPAPCSLVGDECVAASVRCCRGGEGGWDRKRERRGEEKAGSCLFWQGCCERSGWR